MRFIIGCNEKMFYWREYTGEVVWTSDDRHYEVIGYADNAEKAKEVAIAWM